MAASTPVNIKAIQRVRFMQRSLAEDEPGIVRRPADHLERESILPFRIDPPDHRSTVAVLKDERRARQLVFTVERLGFIWTSDLPCEAVIFGKRQLDCAASCRRCFPIPNDVARRRSLGLSAGRRWRCGCRSRRATLGRSDHREQLLRELILRSDPDDFFELTGGRILVAGGHVMIGEYKMPVR